MNKSICILPLLLSLGLAAEPVCALNKTAGREPVTIKILGVNDFHGQISTGNTVNNRPVGGAAVMAAYLRDASHGYENNTVIAFSGDLVGASVPASGLLDHEPSIIFLNSLANSYCQPDNKMHAKCNMVAAVGNHEFDAGQARLRELIDGTMRPPKNNWISLPAYPGTSFPYLSANIVSADTGKTIFPPYVIKDVNGIPVAFIGAILKGAAGTMLPVNSKGIRFLDEAASINQYVPEIKKQGVNIIIVVMHEGGDNSIYEGDTRLNTTVNGAINDIVYALDDSIDVVMAGHTHRFLNAYLNNHNGHQVLVTQASSYSAAFAEVNLSVDYKTRRVIQKTARIIPMYADVYPGTKPDAAAEAIVKLAEDNVAPVVNRYIGTLTEEATRFGNEAGESALGDLAADAVRNSMHADIGLINSSSMRTNLKAGDVTWGMLYAVQPFGNLIVKMKFKGRDILDLLEQQWQVSHKDILQVSGLSYSYDESRLKDHYVYGVEINGKPLEADKDYSIAVNSFLAYGGSGFSVMKRGEIIEHGGTDLDALVNYVQSLPQPFSAHIYGRIINNLHKEKAARYDSQIFDIC